MKRLLSGVPLEVLIVDDDPASRSVIRRCLSDTGVSIGCTFDISEEGSAAAIGVINHRPKPFDCVFLVNRPLNADALGFLQKLYNPLTDMAQCPIVFLADRGCETIMLDALHFGAQDCLLKETITPEALTVAIIKARELYDLKLKRHHAEEELQQVRKMEAVGRLTSGVAHDFNNLLTVVMGNIHLLRRRFNAGFENYEPDDILTKIIAIETVAEKGAELVRRLMLFTRQSPLEEAPVDVNNCVSETIELLRRTLNESIEIETILSPVPWTVLLDPVQFENILINFAINARDAMPDGGKLIIETENVFLDEQYTLRHPDMDVGPYVMIAISDTGTGMTPDVLKNVFEPFFTTKPAGEGTGLGMSMAYGFVKQCGGFLHAYSEPGYGTVFRIYLPRIGGDDDIKTIPVQVDTPQGGETILVTEDDEDVRNVVVNMLKKLGYKTLEAANANAALDLFREHEKIDVVFTDIVMPGDMNGVELIQIVRQKYPHIKVLFTSGYTENAIPNYQFCTDEEMISKPYRRDALAKKLQKILHGDRAQNV